MLVNRIKEIRPEERANGEVEDCPVEDETLTLAEELRHITDPHQLHQKLRQLPDDRIGNNFKMFFTQKLSQMSKEEAADSSLEFISTRHNDLVHLHNSIAELQQLFVDVAILVREQDILIDNIESNVQMAGSSVQKAEKEMKTAVVYQKKSRRKMKVVLASVVGAIATIGIPTAIVLAKKH